MLSGKESVLVARMSIEVHVSTYGPLLLRTCIKVLTEHSLRIECCYFQYWVYCSALSVSPLYFVFKLSIKPSFLLIIVIRVSWLIYKLPHNILSKSHTTPRSTWRCSLPLSWLCASSGVFLCFSTTTLPRRLGFVSTSAYFLLQLLRAYRNLSNSAHLNRTLLGLGFFNRIKPKSIGLHSIRLSTFSTDSGNVELVSQHSQSKV